MRSGLLKTEGLGGFRQFACLTLAVIAIVLWICATCGPKDTSQRNDLVYEERHLSTWVQELVPAYPLETRLRAREAVSSIGTNAIPLFLEYLSKRDNRFMNLWQRTLEKLGKRSPLPEPLTLRNLAVAGFGALGPHGRSAVPEIQKLMMDRHLAYDAARALGAMKAEEAIPRLVDYLDRSEPEMRSAGAAGLGSMGLRARSAVPKLVQLISRDKSDSVRANAVDALAAIGPPDTSIPVLLDRLEMDESPEVRFCAVYGLGCFPGRADLLERILKTAQQDKSERVRIGAGIALQHLQAGESVRKDVEK